MIGLRNILVLIVALTGGMAASAQQKLHSQREVEMALTQLDSAVVHKNDYQTARLRRIDSLEIIVKTCRPGYYLDKCKELYEAVGDVDGRRALKALERIEHTQEYQDDPHLRTWTRLNMSQVYGFMGLYHKANQITNTTVARELTRDEQVLYYITCLMNSSQISDYTSDISLEKNEESSIIAFHDSILALHPDEFTRNFALANKELHLRHPDKALAAVEDGWEHSKGKQRLYMLLMLASIYEMKGKPQEQIYYLAIAALEDLKSGTTNYVALSRLVHPLYDTGDIHRAYQYLVCTMEDANKYPSRSLSLDVSRYFPIISTAYNEDMEWQDRADQLRRNSLIVTFTLLVLAIGVAFYMAWRQNNAAREKKRADELQKALDQATIADRVKSIFIQNMRHEIRTPLNAIVGFAQLLSNDLSDEERALYNGYIQENNDHLLDTLDSIIDVSNMEVGTFNFAFTPVDIDQLCNEQMEKTRMLLPEGVAYIYQPQKPGMQFCTDGKRVGQVLYNLLSNACKHTTTGSITLEVTHLADDDRILFVVTDTGTGIPAEKADVIFEHFEKLDHYAPGLGLGLYVSQLIVRALGGEIHLDTQYDQGARFAFTIPNHQP